MIKLISRNEIFELNHTLAAYIIDLQDVIYNPGQEYNRLEPGDIYANQEGKTIKLTLIECEELNQKSIDEFQAERDIFEAEPLSGQYGGKSIFELPSSEINSYPAALGDTIERLAQMLNWKSVHLILDYPTSWLTSGNKYKPYLKAMKYLKNTGVTESFHGGFQANGQDLKALLANLFWVIRCNGALPGCYFSGLETAFVASICQYGNIHFEFYSEYVRDEILEAATKVGMISVAENNCR